MKIINCVLILSCISLEIFSQEISSDIRKVTKPDGKEVYVFNKTGIKDYDFGKIEVSNREKTFISIVESLIVVDCPLDVTGIFGQVKNYKNLPYSVAKDVFSVFMPNPAQKILGWMPRDSIYFIENMFFDFNGKEFGGNIEVHVKICPLARVVINENYYSILIYTITAESQCVFLVNFSKKGELISADEVIYRDSFYAETGDDLTVRGSASGNSEILSIRFKSI
jgi:hypothetical protein